MSKNCFLSKISQYKTLIIYSALAIAFTTLFSARIGKKKQRISMEFASAKGVFKKWDASLGKNCPEFKNFHKILKKHPELTTAYQAEIGQKLLNAYQPNEAKPFVIGSVERTSQPYYSLYARTSMTISEGNFKEALDEAEQLKESMEKDVSLWEKLGQNGGYGGSLFAFNLARIAMLFGDLNDKKNEKKAWEVLKSYSDEKTLSKPQDIAIHEGVVGLISHLTVQECSLMDYINSR